MTILKPGLFTKCGLAIRLASPRFLGLPMPL